MAIAQVVAGARILISDLNAYYSLLKGSAGESITLIYNAAAAVVLQPSSDPTSGTEAVQIKNNAGTVQGSLTFDGKVKTADGTAALPSVRFQSEATGFYLSAAGVLGVAASGATTNILMRANAISIGATPATAGQLRLPNNSNIYGRNSTNAADLNMLSLDGGNGVNIGDAAAAQVAIVSSPTYIGSALANYFQFSGAAASSHPQITATGSDSSINIKLAPKGSGIVDLVYAVTALGGGAAPTLGTIGGSGPAAAAQNSWLKVNINGTASYIPVWR